jgi:hypothetical protein
VADITDRQQKAVGLISQIPFGAIIGGPLNAAVDAQAAAAAACYDFIKNVGFELEPQKDDQGNPLKDKDGKTIMVPGKVREITFRYERRTPAPAAGNAAAAGNAPAQVTATTEITVPLLTVMPLPFIRIETLTVAYKVSITAEDAHTDTTTSQFQKGVDGGGSFGWGLWKAEFKASVSSKRDSTATNTSKYSVEQTMDVNVHAVQDDMPAGMAKILEILTNAIQLTTRV